MKVTIKEFAIGMEVKSKGVEFEVKGTPAAGGSHRGDLIVTSTKLIWCPGRTARENGIAVTWDKFIDFMESSSPSDSN